jgi:hypothetical protein
VLGQPVSGAAGDQFPAAQFFDQLVQKILAVLTGNLRHSLQIGCPELLARRPDCDLVAVCDEHSDRLLDLGSVEQGGALSVAAGSGCAVG